MKITPRGRQLASQLLLEANGDIVLATQLLRESKKALPTEPYTPKSPELIASINLVNKSYKVGRTKVQALNNVSLDVHKGEFVAITGTSGSGKSTLLQIIGGLDKPDSGSIEIAGQNLAHLNDRNLSRFRNRTIGFVFQFFYLQPFLDLQANVEVPAMFARTKRSERHSRSQILADTVGLSERLRHLPRELSGGQMQRAAIARALQNEPRILLADEPTGNLDRKNALAIFALFREICDKQGTTVIVVTHDLGLASSSDRVVEMRDGSIV